MKVLGATWPIFDTIWSPLDLKGSQNLTFSYKTNIKSLMKVSRKVSVNTFCFFSLDAKMEALRSQNKHVASYLLQTKPSSGSH